jgi:phospholipase/carboxylesterase
MALVTCRAHGLRYDPSVASGCVLCRRTSRPPARSGGGGARVVVVAALVACAVGGGLLAWRNLGGGAGARAHAAGSETTLRTMNRDGRSGAAYVPSHDPARPLPLLVAIHGTGSSGHAAVAAFRAMADANGFAIVAPESRKSPHGQWTWEVGDHAGEVTEDYAHVMACVREVTADLRVDAEHVLIVGHSGGASTAPYVATNEPLFTAFAVLHGGVFPGGFGTHRVRGWFSSGNHDPLRPADGVARAADAARSAGVGDVEMHVFEGGHEVSAAEMDALVAWWLR